MLDLTQEELGHIGAPEAFNFRFPRRQNPQRR
jgi:hypothetical protein